jgi:hypothetical protein
MSFSLRKENKKGCLMITIETGFEKKNHIPIA